MRRDSTDQEGRVVDGIGVFTEDPNVPEMPVRPLVKDMPEVAVIPKTPEVPDELDIIRERVLRINNIPGAPAPARSGFWDKDANKEPFNN